MEGLINKIQFIWGIICIRYHIPVLKNYYACQQAMGNSVSFIQFMKFRLGYNKRIYWPVSKNSKIMSPDNIFVGKNSKVGLDNGCYIQGNGLLYIGNYVRVTSNCGILSSNHDVYDHRKSIKKETIIGDHSWIGMNSVIMPGVILGERTIVGSGSVVTKSFPDGFCIIGGNPAKLIKELDRDKVVLSTSDKEFYGFVSAKNFAKFRKKHLKHMQFSFDISQVSNCDFFIKRKNNTKNKLI